MKTFCCFLRSGAIFAAACAAQVLGTQGFAQTIGYNSIPVVTVQATQPVATTNHPGVFAVFRQGDTNLALNVWYELGGTASNGVDYALIPPHLEALAAGAISNTIVITPLKDVSPSSAAKTVVLTLTNSPLMTPINYQIGSPSRAMVYIETGGVTNLPPAVKIFSPTNGQVFVLPPTNSASPIVPSIPIFAAASDVDGHVTNVEFYADGKDLGPGAMVVLDPPGVNGVTGPVWFLNWFNPPTGNHALTAVATDNGGAATVSDPVNISVLQSPPTNLPPVARILSPTNGQTFFPAWRCPPCATNVPPCDAPCYLVQPDITICADARDADGYVDTVEFFAGTNSLGIRTNCLACDSLQNPFCLTWSNVPAGEYVLSAKATDNDGASTTSDPVKITVLSFPPPLTNLPPVVRIASPANGAMFFAPVNIPLYAYAKDFDGSVASVEFFDGANSLGFGQPLPSPIAGALPPVYPTNLFFLIWSNAPVSTHALTAEATDNRGATAISDLVKIAVLPSPPPPTNRPPVVNIVASDPVAIEGTNCFTWQGETNSPPTWSAWPTAVGRSFTNCGPKTATFTVRRFGDTNDDLTVAYVIGGTASNGVDYVALPGFVAIPAGERRALITIVPVDDGPPDVNKTVILALAPSTNTPPDYVLGYPPRAAALIIDSEGPRPTAAVLADKCFHLATPGPDAAWFCIQYSTDLRHWTSVCTNQVIHGSIDFIDPDAAKSAGRFYRAMPINDVPAE